MKRIFLFTSMISTAVVFAQNEMDALRYSNLNYFGTARFASMGGAFGALGADLSNASVNPAGIAAFRSTELSFTPSLFSQRTDATYNNSSLTDNKLNFNFGNIGLVTSFDKEKNGKGWMNTSFAIGYNRINNFNSRTYIVGENATSSFLDALVNNANGTTASNLNPFGELLAFQTYLIDTIPNSSGRSYRDPIPSGSVITQSKSIETRGSMGETYLSYGGNFNNKIYIGGTIGINNLRYREESTYEELDSKDSIFDFQKLRYTGDLTTRGTGINFKFGMLLRPADWVRFGGAVHSPTYFSLQDNYSNQMTAYYDNGDKLTSDLSEGSFDYRITTPFRAIGSLAFILAKKGLISADYELVDYSSALLSANGGNFSDANNAIKSKYNSTNNIRLGAEMRFDPITVRAGYAVMGSPFKNATGVNGIRKNYSFGLGYRTDTYFIDLAYVFSQYQENYYLYDASLVNAVKTKSNATSVMVTMGIRY